MELEQRVSSQFAASIETLSESAATLPDSISAAALLMVNCLLNNGKILTSGNGGCAGLAQHFAAQLLHRFERERPALPALALTADSCTNSAIANDEGYLEIYAKQISALGQQGDVLLSISCDGHCLNQVSAIQAAQEREMPVVALTGKGGGQIGSLLGNQDIEIRVPESPATRTLEVHQLTIHSLCDLIDYQLFGGGE